MFMFIYLCLMDIMENEENINVLQIFRYDFIKM